MEIIIIDDKRRRGALYPTEGASRSLCGPARYVISSSHKVAVKILAFPRHFCPEGRSQQVSEAGPSVRICNVEKEH